MLFPENLRCRDIQEHQASSQDLILETKREEAGEPVAEIIEHFRYGFAAQGIDVQVRCIKEHPNGEDVTLRVRPTQLKPSGHLH